MIFNMILSSLALARYTERNTVSVQPENGQVSSEETDGDPLNAFLDEHFPDERMERIYPNAKMVE